MIICYRFVEIQNCSFENNMAVQLGDALYLEESMEKSWIDSVIFKNNFKNIAYFKMISISILNSEFKGYPVRNI